jgi:hypothetical protein
MKRTHVVTGLAVALLVSASCTWGGLAHAQPAPATPAPLPAPTAESWPENPAKAADPSPLPAPTHEAPPAQGPPTSTSGTDVVPLLPTPPPAAPDPEAARRVAAAEARVFELEARIAQDEARLRALEKSASPFRHLKLMGYVQLQYLVESANAAASPNRQADGTLPQGISPNDVIARADGTTTNANRFRLRRTRFGATYETRPMRIFLQVDPLPSGGPASTQTTIARNAEVTGIARWTSDVRTELTGGLFNVPFRMELEELSLFRPFIERSWASLNLFPTERDLGVHARTYALDDALVVDVGILNGQRLGEPKFTVQPDLNGSKDFFATITSRRVGFLDMSVSGYLGRGQVVDATALRVKNYGRYAVNLGARFGYRFVPRLGETRVIGEFLYGSNMDTGVVYAFARPAVPARFTDDVKSLGERAVYLRAEQDLTRWGIAGVRYDTYTPDASETNNARDTYTFMLGARFSKYLRLVNELSYAIDNVHPAGGTAPSQHLVTYSAWLQGSFY